MTVVVTGASGHVGGNLVRALVEQGRQVRCLVREDVRAIEGLPVQRVTGDVRDPESLRRTFAGADVVFHLAARISIQGGLGGLVNATNNQGARNVAEAALACGVRRLVHCSSIHAFDQLDWSKPVDENMPRALAHSYPAYDQSKACGEQAVREVIARGLDAVIVHPTGVLGPNDFKLSRMGRVLVMLHQRKLPALIPGGFDWVDVRDVVRSILAAETHGRTNESYVLAGRWLSVRELAALAAQITGIPAPRFSVPLWMAYVGAPFAGALSRLRGTEPLFNLESLHALGSNPRIDGSKAARELGHTARPLFDTLRDSYAWFAEAGVINLAAERERC